MAVSAPELEKTDDLERKLEQSIAEIGLCVRTCNSLEGVGVFTVLDLLNCTAADLLSIKNFGGKSLEEVYKCLEPLGFVRRNASQPRAQAA